MKAARRLLEGGNPEMLGQVRDVIRDAADLILRMSQIIWRVRDFITRKESEKQVENVATLVEEASTLALVGSNESDVNLHYHFDSNALLVFVNRIQIQQVLTNLIRNANEAISGCGRRDLGVTTARLDDKTIEIAVSDTGVGLSSYSDQQFRPFVSTKPHGMGLGLSICRSIVEAHGGHLSCEPNPGGGTIFRFTVAAVGADDAK